MPKTGTPEVNFNVQVLTHHITMITTDDRDDLPQKQVTVHDLGHTSAPMRIAKLRGLATCLNKSIPHYCLVPLIN